MSPCTCSLPGVPHGFDEHHGRPWRKTVCKVKGCRCVRYRRGGWELGQLRLFALLLALAFAAPAEALSPVALLADCGAEGAVLVVAIDGAATGTRPLDGSFSLDAAGPWVELSTGTVVEVPCKGETTFYYDGDRAPVVGLVIPQQNFYLDALVGLAGLVAGSLVAWGFMKAT